MGLRPRGRRRSWIAGGRAGAARAKRPRLDRDREVALRLEPRADSSLTPPPAAAQDEVARGIESPDGPGASVRGGAGDRLRGDERPSRRRELDRDPGRHPGCAPAPGDHPRLRFQHARPLVRRRRGRRHDRGHRHRVARRHHRGDRCRPCGGSDLEPDHLASRTAVLLRPRARRRPDRGRPGRGWRQCGQLGRFRRAAPGGRARHPRRAGDLAAAGSALRLLADPRAAPSRAPRHDPLAMLRSTAGNGQCRRRWRSVTAPTTPRRRSA